MAAGGENDAQESASGGAAVVSTISIQRARWDADEQTLEVRGAVSSARVQLSAEFLDRSEGLSNDKGEFRAEFSGVSTNPGSVVVLASDGGRADAAVEEH